jgi:hypothetical protein
VSQPDERWDSDAADALRAWAADERAHGQDAQGTDLAAVLEALAADGLPAVEECVAWEEIREDALARLGPAGQGPGPGVGPTSRVP